MSLYCWWQCILYSRYRIWIGLFFLFNLYLFEMWLQKHPTTWMQRNISRIKYSKTPGYHPPSIVHSAWYVIQYIIIFKWSFQWMDKCFKGFLFSVEPIRARPPDPPDWMTVTCFTVKILWRKIYHIKAETYKEKDKGQDVNL